MTPGVTRMAHFDSSPHLLGGAQCFFYLLLLPASSGGVLEPTWTMVTVADDIVHILTNESQQAHDMCRYAGNP